ncbi:ribosome assembly factor SBDS [Candidatus Woesearchaeota archaeon]|nr:ribosome assembly factor SBDS [Candidatus Woesearchaeota archaeon]
MQTFDKERVSFNLARLKKAGRNFEVAVDPDLAIEFKKGKPGMEVRDVIRSEHIFMDVKKGLFAPEKELASIFGTLDVLEIAKQILLEGEIQLTTEYREKMREAKRKRLVVLIARNAVDPRTGLPHPPQRIENAMDEAKIHLDDYKSAEDQMEEVLKQLRPVLPIKIEVKKIAVRVPPEFAGKAYPVIAQFAKPHKEDWLNDGSYACEVEIPGGLVPDFYDKLNHLTHGNVETRELGR